MKALDTSDIHQLRAALGWYELGNIVEAMHELHNVSQEAREHPDALELAWQIFAKKGDWDACRDMAESLTRKDPKRETGWLHFAYATRRATGGSEQAASEILLSVVERFPKGALIPFNLACYACQLGNKKEALEWLQKAFHIGDKKELKQMALDDPDLKPLRSEISEI